MATLAVDHPLDGHRRMRVTSALRKVTTSIRGVGDRVRWGSYYEPSPDNLDRATHLREAAAWLKRAQDAGEDRGVAYGVRFGGTFEPSYPETTGYIIPTCLELAQRGDVDFNRRAVEMGDWEIAVQLESGAVMGGRVDQNPTPAVFNTGQVLFGWTALFQATGDERYRDAAKRAVDWLISMQEPDGRWVRGNSRFAHPGHTLYNAKAAYGLCQAGVTWGWPDAVDAAIRNANHCLQHQRENGWFDNCCLSDPRSPLLHTIAYAMQGLLGIGTLTGEQRFVAAAERTARSLLEVMQPDGFIAGRLNEHFEGTVSWCCLTGSAQTSIVCAGLFESTRDDAFLKGARLLNDYVTARHDISNTDPAIRGGVAGSWPTWGAYGPFRVLNWATKFFIDALLREEQVIGIRTERVTAAHQCGWNR